MKRNKPSEREISSYFNKSPNWLYIVKLQKPTKYKRLYSFDKCPYKSISLYIKYVKQLKEKAEDIYYLWDEENTKDIFLKQYAHKNSVERILFNIVDELSVGQNVIEKLERIVDEYNNKHP